MVAGEFNSIDGVPYSHIARLNADGSVDLTFDPGQPPDGPVYAVSLQEDGRILIAGDFTTVGGNAFARVARLNTDGSLDVSFNPGSGADAVIYALSAHGSGLTNRSAAVRMPKLERIVGGQPTTINQFPYQVALINNPFNQYIFL